MRAHLRSAPLTSSASQVQTGRMSSRSKWEHCGQLSAAGHVVHLPEGHHKQTTRTQLAPDDAVEVCRLQQRTEDEADKVRSRSSRRHVQWARQVSLHISHTHTRARTRNTSSAETNIGHVLHALRAEVASPQTFVRYMYVVYDNPRPQIVRLVNACCDPSPRRDRSRSKPRAAKGGQTRPVDLTDGSVAIGKNDQSKRNKVKTETKREGGRFRWKGKRSQLPSHRRRRRCLRRGRRITVDARQNSGLARRRALSRRPVWTSARSQQTAVEQKTTQNKRKK